MKKISGILIFAFILHSCGNKTEQKQVEPKKTLESNTASNPKDKKITTTNLSISELPDGIKYEGKIKNAVRWTDKSGDNIVITTETGIYQNDKFKHEIDGEDAELFAYHFILSEDSVRQTWKVYDFISDCPVDIVASFIDNSLQITDLDQNGIAEIWLLYQTVCHGDVSPSDMKIIMYEGQQKFAIRGESRVMQGIDDNGNKLYMGGDYKIDQAFSNGPALFLEFAKELWNKHTIETLE